MINESEREPLIDKFVFVSVPLALGDGGGGCTVMIGCVKLCVLPDCCNVRKMKN